MAPRGMEERARSAKKRRKKIRQRAQRGEGPGWPLRSRGEALGAVREGMRWLSEWQQALERPRAAGGREGAVTAGCVHLSQRRAHVPPSCLLAPKWTFLDRATGDEALVRGESAAAHGPRFIVVC